MNEGIIILVFAAILLAVEGVSNLAERWQHRRQVRAAIEQRLAPWRALGKGEGI